MKTINQVVSDKQAKRKERLKKTWGEIIEKGIEAFEVEQAEKRKK